MGHFATGVTVVTVLNERGEPSGLTANALTSVSLDPPLILICIDKNAQSYRCFRKGCCFAVNILSQNQEDLSRKFAKSEPSKFDGVAYRRGVTGCAIVESTIAFMECEIVEEYPGGDHTIFLGEVKESGMSPGSPLLFFKGAYRKFEES
jgi:flavin reductase (DIM6/NTAB) family NADH-FMN oxidoreductase RutF